MTLQQALYSYLSGDAALHLWTAIFSAVLAVILVRILFYIRGLHSQMDEAEGELASTQGALDRAVRLNSSYINELNEWRGLFGPFYSLYKNSPELIPQHNSGDSDIAIDLDGVIFEYDEVWHGVGHVGAVMPGAIESMARLKEMGFRLTVYTTRTNCMTTSDGPSVLELTAMVQKHLDDAGIPYDYISLFKPLARYYIDDRAVRFSTWVLALRDVRNLEVKRMMKRARDLDAMCYSSEPEAPE